MSAQNVHQLNCTVLYCTVLYCTVLYYYCTAVQYVNQTLTPISYKDRSGQNPVPKRNRLVAELRTGCQPVPLPLFARDKKSESGTGVKGVNIFELIHFKEDNVARLVATTV